VHVTNELVVGSDMGKIPGRRAVIFLGELFPVGPRQLAIARDDARYCLPCNRASPVLNAICDTTRAHSVSPWRPHPVPVQDKRPWTSKSLPPVLLEAAGALSVAETPPPEACSEVPTAAN
jgi:hypothetical protein